MRTPRKPRVFSKSLFIIILLAITLVISSFPMAWPSPATEFIDNYINEDNISVKSDVIRNSTLDAIELIYSAESVVAEPPFQIREHDRTAYTPNMVYTLTDTYFQCASGTTSLGYSWHFITNISASWIHGKYLRWNWMHSGYSVNIAYLIDGSYNRTSMVSFPDNAAPVWNGNGILQTLGTVEDTTETDEIQIDASGAALDNVTIFFLLSDSWTAQVMTMRIYWVEINNAPSGVENLMSWDFSTEGTTLDMELSGTRNDYGIIYGGDIAQVKSGGYTLEGYLTTTELLSGISGNTVALLTNATINGTLTVEFSSDNTTWVNHNNVTGSDTVGEGNWTINLVDLSFSTLYLRFNFTRGGSNLTPRLYQIWVITIPDEVVDNYEDSSLIAVLDGTVRNTTLEAIELEWTPDIVLVKEYANNTALASFQYKEHRIWGGTYGWQTQELTANDFREGNDATSSRQAGWMFITVDKDWIHGKYLRWYWYKWGLGFTGGSAYTTPRFRQYDGEYSRSSTTDFAVSSEPAIKGSGGLVLEVDRAGSNCNYWYYQDILIDTSTCNQTFVTFMWADYDYSTTTRLGLILDFVQINTGAGGTGNLWTADIGTDQGQNLYFEVSGTYDDYGLFNGTEGHIIGGYNATGSYYTSELLDEIPSGTTLVLLTNTTLDGLSSMTVEFSSDNTTWVDCDNVSGYEDVIEGFEGFDLRDLSYSTIYTRFNLTRGIEVYDTPRLYQIRLLFSGLEEAATVTTFMKVSAIFWVLLVIIVPIVAYMVKRG